MSTKQVKVRVMDSRKPGWFWVDNEVLDVFGDELGQNGISVYITMARLCRDGRVARSLREIASEARMSKDTVARTMKVLGSLGLVVEMKGAKLRTASTYVLADVKELVIERKALLSHHETVEVVDKKNSPAADATDLSQNCLSGETDLSQNAGPFKYKKENIRKEEIIPYPSQAKGVEGAIDSVMVACGSKNRGLRAAVERALAAARESSNFRESHEAIAQRMIAARTRYLAMVNRGMLRVQYGMKRFYDEGIWADENLWHWDEEKLAQQARARVGT